MGQFEEVKKAYALANKLLGGKSIDIIFLMTYDVHISCSFLFDLQDIPKVTPSSKTVGDLSQFIVTTKISEEELVNNASTLPLPNSVVEYFQGALGSPPGGYPEPFRSNVLKGRCLPIYGRPGSELPSYDFVSTTQSLKEAYGDKRITSKDVLSYALYPQVFKDLIAFEKLYGNISQLPTHLFLRPMVQGEERHLHLGRGKDYYIKLDNIDNFDEDLGTRTVALLVNGEHWYIRTTDTVTTIGSTTEGGPAAPKRRVKKDPTNKGDVGAAMPGQIVEVFVEKDCEVEEGQTLFKLSAMKMETEIKAPVGGIVSKVLVQNGETVEANDLLAVIE